MTDSREWEAEGFQWTQALRTAARLSGRGGRGGLPIAGRG
jgi:hypothetical protein